VNALHAVSPPLAGAESFDRKTIRTSQLLPLIETERFAEALTLLQNAAPSDDPDQALLQAVVAAQAGRFDTARALCDAILQRDELNAGAQYVLALCYEHAGDADRAIYHDQLSAYLDPGFAMPRVHLGLLHKRRGDVSAAGRELREARKLIEREDASRLLLFGGGFGRAALLALCDAELAKGTRERE
jgi:chemotaxis protein methyltransferase CheR